MKYKSFSVYDDAAFFEKYIQKRNLGNAPNERIEKPIMDELIGNVQGKNILDLGCGDGNYGRELLDKGAEAYTGIEGSKNMSNLAIEKLSGTNSKIIHQDIVDSNFGVEKYDLVLSRLVLHYIVDLTSLLQKIERSMIRNGYFVCSLEHPVITSCYDAYHSKAKRKNWIVDNYFTSGERVNTWNGKDVIKYHKTLEEYWSLFKQSNFDIIEIRESKPIESNFEDINDFQRRNRIPLFIFFKLMKK